MAKNEKTQADDDNDVPAPNIPNPWEVLDKLATALSARVAAPDVNPGVMAKLTDALERITEVQSKGSDTTEAIARRLQRQENPVFHGRSVFNRRGTMLNRDATGPVKPPLKCPMFIPWVIEWESCTREEVELLNLLESGNYILRLSDRSKARIAIKLEMSLDGLKPSRLLLYHEAPDGTSGSLFRDRSTRDMVPALPDMLRQLLRQHHGDIPARAAAVMEDEVEEALIEAGELSVSV